MDQEDIEGKPMIEMATAVAVGGAVYMLIKPRLYPGLIAGSISREKSNLLPPRKEQRLLKALGRIGAASPFEHRRLAEAWAEAGSEHGSVDLLKGASVVSGVAGAAVGLAFGAFAIVFSVMLGLLAYRLPIFWLQARRRSRTAAISQGLPDALDLLVVCISAGLNVSLAIDRVAERTPGPLGEELKRAQRLVGLGVPRREALLEMESRSGSPEVGALVSALVTTDRFGSSVAGSLEALSTDLRAKRRRAAEEQARRAPVKMLFPLVFLILPAFILLTIVPLLLGTFRTLGL